MKKVFYFMTLLLIFGACSDDNDNNNNPIYENDGTDKNDTIVSKDTTIVNDSVISNINPLEETTWQLDKNEFPYDCDRCYVIVFSKKNNWYSNGTHNAYAGIIVIDKNSINFITQGLSMGDNQNKPPSDFEHQFFKLIENTSSFEIKEGRLILYSKDKKEQLIFVKSEYDYPYVDI